MIGIIGRKLPKTVFTEWTKQCNKQHNDQDHNMEHNMKLTQRKANKKEIMPFIRIYDL